MSDTAADATVGDLPGDISPHWTSANVLTWAEAAGSKFALAFSAASGLGKVLHRLVRDQTVVGRRWQGAAHSELTIDKAMSLLAMPAAAPGSDQAVGRARAGTAAASARPSAGRHPHQVDDRLR
jgi:hypothetical protein